MFLKSKQSFTNNFQEIGEIVIFELFVNKNLDKIEYKQSFTNFPMKSSILL